MDARETSVKREDRARREPRGMACYRCRFYQVSWDPQHPHGCAAHGFKTRGNPARVVYEASGLECQLFEGKTPTRT
jgi:hypothetical protein